MVEVLRAVAKSDPSIQIDSNLETGEHLMSGMGELHLEITEYRIRNEHGVEITTSPPIVVYRETVAIVHLETLRVNPLINIIDFTSLLNHWKKTFEKLL